MIEADLLTNEITAALQDHAAEQYPREAVGVVLQAQSGLVYQAMANIAADPTRHAAMDPEQMAAIHASGQLRAVAHSHPDGPDCPSEQDMISQIEHAVPFIITSTNGEACLAPFAWGDQLDRKELVGRGFRHGVTDCYACVRDYYWLEHGIDLPNVPRNWEWWNQDQNLYVNTLAEAGFRVIDETEMRPGDGVLMRIRSPVPNHAGVLAQPGLLLHHVTATQAWDPSRLSRREPLGRWRNYVSHWLRHESLNAS